MCKFLMRATLLILSIFISINYIDTAIVASENPNSTDFKKFHITGERLNAGLPMYWQTGHQEKGQDCGGQGHSKSDDQNYPTHRPIAATADNPGCLHPNLNPPLWGGLFSLLGRFEFATASLAWSMASLAALLASVAIAACWGPLQHAGIDRATTIWLGTVIVLAYHPTHANQVLGQLSLLLMPLLFASWVLLRKKRDLSAGALLGLLIALKPFFGLFILALVAANRKKAAVSCLSVFVVCLGISLATWGMEAHFDYLSNLRGVNWTGYNWNASFTGFFSRTLGGGGSVPIIDAPHASRTLILLTSTGCVAWLCWHLNKATDHTNKENCADEVFSATLPCMLLASPLGWLYYFPWILLTLLVACHRLGHGKNNIVPRALIIMFLIMTGIPRSLVPPSEIISTGDALWDGSLCFYGLLAITLALVTKTKTRKGA